MARWFLLLLSGCSLAITGPSPGRPRNKPPTCDTSKGRVALDAVVAATMGVVALSLATGNNGGEAVGPLLVGGLFAASAIHGNNVVNACNRDQANYESEMAGNRAREQPGSPSVGESGAAGGLAMEPAVSLPSATAPLPPPQLAPPGAPAQAPTPPEEPPAASAPAPADDAWTAFWKEVP